MSGRRLDSVRQDIDWVDCDGEGLIYNEDWITPSYSKGYRKIRLTDSISVYYHFERHYLFYNVVLSFEYLGAHTPKSLPILFYGYVNMLDTWEREGKEAQEEDD